MSRCEFCPKVKSIQGETVGLLAYICLGSGIVHPLVKVLSERTLDVSMGFNLNPDLEGMPPEELKHFHDDLVDLKRLVDIRFFNTEGYLRLIEVIQKNLERYFKTGLYLEPKPKTAIPEDDDRILLVQLQAPEISKEVIRSTLESVNGDVVEAILLLIA